MKVLFMTGGARSQTFRHLIKNNVSIVALVTPMPSKGNSRFLDSIEVANTFNIPHLAVSKDNIDQTLLTLDFDILVSCGFSYILPIATVEKARFAINVHATLLPKYRGYRSVPFIIMNGERESGVTIHFISDQMDDGDIILQESFPLNSFDTVKSHVRKSLEIEADLLLKAINQLKNGNFSRVKQNPNSASTYNQMRTPKDSIVDWNLSLKELYNSIRACDPKEYPAYFYLDGQKVCIKLWRPDKPPEEDDLI